MARNLYNAAEGFLVGKRYLIHDQDPLFTAELFEILRTSGVISVKLPPRLSQPNIRNGCPGASPVEIDSPSL
jgi:hypothetical protein